MQELFSFKQENPHVDLEPFLAQSSQYFRDYIEQGLRKIEEEGSAMPISSVGGIGDMSGLKDLKQHYEMNIGEKVDVVKREIVGKLDELKKDLEKVAEEKGEVVEKVDHDQVKKELKEVKQELESLKRKLPPPTSVPECPICMEEMTPPTKIVQCLKGHKICEPCSQREEVMFCPGHCKTGFMGRDLGMEAFVLKITDEAQGVRASGSPMSK